MKEDSCRDNFHQESHESVASRSTPCAPTASACRTE
jgi:hypothetical protein